MLNFYSVHFFLMYRVHQYRVPQEVWYPVINSELSKTSLGEDVFQEKFKPTLSLLSERENPTPLSEEGGGYHTPFFCVAVTLLIPCR